MVLVLVLSVRYAYAHFPPLFKGKLSMIMMANSN
jgi:hypothetical protein